ncbi:MAG: hypothetical protein Q8Q03_02145 [bacterium]|nr:hypothetical protein [bacterium]
MEKIVQDIMSGERVSIVAESKNDAEIDRFIRSLRKMQPEVNVNCNIIILKNNVCRITADLWLQTKEDWIESALLETFKETRLEIHRVQS